MIRVSDYIANYLSKAGIKYIFTLVGGGSMFLNDSFGYHKDLKCIYVPHEQIGTMAAVGYAKYTGKPAVVCVTTGCGGTNTLTGVLDAYQDKVPLLVISGQVKCKETIRHSQLNIRQFGVQEANIIPIVLPITKFAEMIEDPTTIKFYLDKALSIATEENPGPVWLDIPLDVQGAMIDETKLEGFTPTKIKRDIYTSEFTRCIFMLNDSLRPIVIVGNGVRLANAIDEFKDFIESNGLPTVSTKLGIDILKHDSPMYIGTIGTKGDRAGNFAVQNADLILCIGSRLSVGTTGQDFKTFARESKKIVVDINKEEHCKQTVHPDLFINLDAKQFLSMMHFIGIQPKKTKWVETCQHWKQIWPTYSPKYAESTKINLYYFIEVLSHKLRPDDVIVGDAGSAMFVPAQGLYIRDKQRLIFTACQTDMGFAVPACIGIALAKQGDVIATVGDGSFLLNINALQTIHHHNLPIKIFVWNNNGYLTIRNTQNNFFGRLAGISPETGLSFPDLSKIADAYGIKYMQAPTSESLPSVIQDALDFKGPVLCEVMCLYEQAILTVSSKKNADGSFVSRPLEDMSPFLPRGEFNREIIIKPVDASNE